MRLYLRMPSQNPSINENSPNTPTEFLSYINRDQYGAVNSFDPVGNKIVLIIIKKIYRSSRKYLTNKRTYKI